MNMVKPLSKYLNIPYLERIAVQSFFFAQSSHEIIGHPISL